MLHYARFLLGKSGGGAISFVGSGVASGVGLTSPVVSYSNGFRNTANAVVVPAVGDCIFIMMCQATTGVRSTAQLQPFSNAEVSGNDLFTAMAGTNFSGADTNYASGKLFYQFVQSYHTQVTIPTCGATAGSHAGIVLCLRGCRTVANGGPQDGNTAGAGFLNGAAPDAPSVTPTIAGSWILVGCAGASASASAFLAPADLSSGTNHFSTTTANGTTQDAIVGLGFKSNWTSGAFDPVAWGGSDAQATTGHLAYSAIIVPNP